MKPEREWLRHSFVRFALAGAINTLIGTTIIVAFRYGAGWTYGMSTFFGNAAGASVSFLLNKAYTFRSGVPSSTAAVRFIAVVLICYFLAYNLGLRAAVILLNAIGMSDLPVEDHAILFGICLYTLLNYWGQKLFVFRDRTPVGNQA